jgi:hypothetical protein
MNTMIASATQVRAYMFQQTQYRSQNAQTSARNVMTETSVSVMTIDRIEIGTSGDISTADALKVVTERVLAQMRAAIGETRQSLGHEYVPMDTSAEATAARIFNFAINFFDSYSSQHPELDESQAKEQFVDLIGGAVKQGIQEARDILSGIAPISDPISDKIDVIAALLDEKFSQFLQDTVPESALGNGIPTRSLMTN